MERLSVPRSVAMKITGHKTESVYRRDAIVSDAGMRAAAPPPQEGKAYAHPRGVRGLCERAMKLARGPPFGSSAPKPGGPRPRRGGAAVPPGGGRVWG